MAWSLIPAPRTPTLTSLDAHATKKPSGSPDAHHDPAAPRPRLLQVFHSHTHQICRVPPLSQPRRRLTQRLIEFLDLHPRARVGDSKRLHPAMPMAAVCTTSPPHPWQLYRIQSPARSARHCRTCGGIPGANSHVSQSMRSNASGHLAWKYSVKNRLNSSVVTVFHAKRSK